MKNEIFILTFIVLSAFSIAYAQDDCADLNACNYGLNELCWYANEGCTCEDGEGAQPACDQLCYASDDFNAPLVDCAGDCGGDATEDCAGVCDSDPTNDNLDTDLDGVCDVDEALGCSDINACNYDELATEDDGSCIYPEDNYDCDGTCIASGENLDNLGLDCAGECGGSSIEDCTGVCNGDSIIDECGVCNGLGAIYDCGCFDVLEGYCDCEGSVDNSILFPDCAGVCHPETIVGVEDEALGLQYGSVIDECVYAFNGESTGDCIFGGSSNPEWNANCTGCDDSSADNYADGCAEEYACNHPGYNCEYTSSTPPDWFYEQSTNFYTILISSILLDGMPASETDIVGIFYNDICIGYKNVDPNSNVFYIYGQDENHLDYPQDGDAIEFKFYDSTHDVVLNLFGSQAGDLPAEFDAGGFTSIVQANAECPPPNVNEVTYENFGTEVLITWDSPEIGLQPIEYAIDGNIIPEGEFSYIDILDWSASQDYLFTATNACGYHEQTISVEIEPEPFPGDVASLAVDFNDNNAGEGQFLLTWEVIENHNYYSTPKFNIYRSDVEGDCGSILATIEDRSYFDQNLFANTNYYYCIQGVNSLNEEGNVSTILETTTEPIPIVELLSTESSDARIEVYWEQPSFIYGDKEYWYNLYRIDENNNENNYIHIIETTSKYAHESHALDMLDNSFCYTVTAENEHGESDYYLASNNENCNSPDLPFGHDIDWGVQVEVAFSVPGSDNRSDNYNLIGSDSSASDGFDPDFDFPEVPGGNQNPIRLYFPHGEWQAEQGTNFTRDIRGPVDLSVEKRDWNGIIDLTDGGNTSGEVSLRFFFIDYEGTQEFLDYDNGVYLLLENENNAIEIFDGQQVSLGIFNPQNPFENKIPFTVTVGNAVPSAPEQVEATGSYREIELSWIDTSQYGTDSYVLSRLEGSNTQDTVKIEGITNSSYIDRGLNPNTNYTYYIQGQNEAGLSFISSDAMIVSQTKINRAPISDSGIDSVIIYDVEADGIVDFILPINHDFTLHQNFSFDPDNSYYPGEVYYADNYYVDMSNSTLYDSPSDNIVYSWYKNENINETLSFNSIAEISLELGQKKYILRTEDQYEDFTESDVFVFAQSFPNPEPAQDLSSENSLYKIDIRWVESYYTGEPFADINMDGQHNEAEILYDCGIDNICPGDFDYNGPDFGEGNQSWDYLDVNQNGIWDYLSSGSGSDNLEKEPHEHFEDSINVNGKYDIAEPFIDEDLDEIYDSGTIPPFYGFYYNDYPKNPAVAYEVWRDNELIEVISKESFSDYFYSGDSYHPNYRTFEYSDKNLEADREYTYIIKTVNPGNYKIDSAEFTASTQPYPSVTIMSPNGPDILSAVEDLHIVLDYGSEDFITNVDIDLAFVNDPEESDWLSPGVINGVSNEYYFNIADLLSSVLVDQNLYQVDFQIRAKIEDTCAEYSDVLCIELEQYTDKNDNTLTFSSNTITHNLDQGWHIIGLPLSVPGNPYLSSYLNQEGMEFFNVWGWMENNAVADPTLSNGEGYYLRLPVQTGGSFIVQGDVLTSDFIELEQGWNLISNPLSSSVNLDKLNIVYNNIDYSWSDAVEYSLIQNNIIGLNEQSMYQLYSFLEPFKGYWLHANEEGMQLKVDYHDPSEIDDLDWQLNLCAKENNPPNYDNLGDCITIGLDGDANSSFKYGEDQYKNPIFPDAYRYTRMHIDHSDWYPDIISDYQEFMTDIRNGEVSDLGDTSYVFNIEGEWSSISNNILLSWDVNSIIDLDDEIFDIFIQTNNNNQTDLRQLADGQLLLTQQEFESFSIIIERKSYYAGCLDESACNYSGNSSNSNWNGGSGWWDDGSCIYDGCDNGCEANVGATNYDICLGEDVIPCYESGFGLVIASDYCTYPMFANESFNQFQINIRNNELVPISSVAFKLNYDPEVITFPNPSSEFDVFDFIHEDIIIGATESDWQILIEDFGSGLIGVALFYSGADQGEVLNGPILTINVKNINDNAINENTNISFSDVSINGNNDIFYNIGRFNIQDGFTTLGGKISLSSENSNELYSTPSLGDVSITVSGVSYQPLDAILETYSAVSDGNNAGQYQVTNIKDGYSYEIQLDRAGDFSEYYLPIGVTASDVSRLARWLLGSESIELNPLQLVAANMDFGLNDEFDNKLDFNDVSLLAKYAIGNLDPDSWKKFWAFVPHVDGDYEISDDILTCLPQCGAGNDNILMAKVDNMQLPFFEEAVAQDFIGIKIGDVTRDWEDSNRLSQLSKNDEDSFVYDYSNVNISLPIQFENKVKIEGMRLILDYDPSMIAIKRFVLNSDFSEEDFGFYESDDNGFYSLIIYALSEDLYTHDVIGELEIQLIDESSVENILDVVDITINGNEVRSGFMVQGANGEPSLVHSLRFSKHLVPDDYALYQNYPNPFNPSTTIKFAVPQKSLIEMDVYDIKGRLIENLTHQNWDAGYHSIRWHADHLSSGVYFIKIKADSFTATQKIVLIK